MGSTCQFSDTTVLQEKTVGVKIMTIHKSKGLEFPLVFICCMASAPNNRTSSFIQYKDLPITKNYKSDFVYKNYYQRKTERKRIKGTFSRKEKSFYMLL